MFRVHARIRLNLVIQCSLHWIRTHSVVCSGRVDSKENIHDWCRRLASIYYALVPEVDSSYRRSYGEAQE
jgi:hypothetical protein